MRKLTVTRTKKFAACAAKLGVYISSPEGEFSIRGTPCRRLGLLGNGKTESFEIGEDAARVFVVANEKSADIFNEFCDIPAGSEDVSLAGHNELALKQGNPFVFDNVPVTSEMEQNRAAVAENMRGLYEKARKKGRRVGIAVGISAFVVTFAAAFIISFAVTNKPKTFTADGAFEVTLTNRFEETGLGGGDDHSVACYVSKEATVYVDRFRFEEMEYYLGDQAAEIPLGEFSLAFTGKGVEPRVKDGMLYTVTEGNDGGSAVKYYDFYYKGGDSFWTLTFIAKADEAAKREEDFFKWAKTAKPVERAE